MNLRIITKKYTDDPEIGFPTKSILTDTGENVQKWTRVFSTRR